MLAEQPLIVPAHPGAEVRGHRIGFAVILVVRKNTRLQRLPPGAGLAYRRRVQRRIEGVELSRYDELPDRQRAVCEIWRVVSKNAWLQLLVHARISPQVNAQTGMQPFVAARDLLMPLNAITAFENRCLDCGWLVVGEGGDRASCAERRQPQ